MLRILPEIIDVCAIVDGELVGDLGLPGRGAPLEGGTQEGLPEGVGGALGW
jgi:hypothetical protein